MHVTASYKSHKVVEAKLYSSKEVILVLSHQTDYNQIIVDKRTEETGNMTWDVLQSTQQ